MEVLKRWSYIVLFLAAGIVYLSCVDDWQVYEKPLAWLKEWYGGSGYGNGIVASAGGAWQGGRLSGGAGEDGNIFGGFLEGIVAIGELTGIDNEGEETYGEGEGDFGEGAPEVVVDTESLSGEGEETPDPAVPEEPGEKEPNYVEVGDDYFADAVFIGDSRTVGLFEYGGLEETAAFYASKGLTIYKMFDSEIVSVPGEKKKITVEEALQQNKFAKIYLMIGINEMGTGTVDTFIAKYQESVEHLRELQPDAIIYLQAIIKVTTERSNQGDYINNEGIVARNEAIAQLADNEKIFYLDVNPLICDETGGMVASYTFDGVHLMAKYIEIWKDFLKQHAVPVNVFGQE